MEFSVSFYGHEELDNMSHRGSPDRDTAPPSVNSQNRYEIIPATRTSASQNVLWTLAYLMLPKADRLPTYQLIHVEARIVDVDIVPHNEVAFKLTTDSISTLLKYHKDMHCHLSEIEQQPKMWHDHFVQAINKFVYRTDVSALELH
jgi:hypothetical protein